MRADEAGASGDDNSLVLQIHSPTGLPPTNSVAIRR
jgi:hypothetical protein